MTKCTINRFPEEDATAVTVSQGKKTTTYTVFGPVCILNADEAEDSSNKAVLVELKKPLDDFTPNRFLAFVSRYNFDGSTEEQVIVKIAERWGLSDDKLNALALGHLFAHGETKLNSVLLPRLSDRANWAIVYEAVDSSEPAADTTFTVKVTEG